MPYLSYMKTFPGLADAFLRDPGLYRPLLEFIEQVMIRDSELTKAEREILASLVSRHNGCDFCVGVHNATLESMGVDRTLITALDGTNAADGISVKFREMLAFADKLTVTPELVDQGDIDKLLIQGWSEQAIEDAINVIALFNYVNRLVDGLGIKAEDGYFRQIGKTLAQRGYAPLIEAALKRAS